MSPQDLIDIIKRELTSTRTMYNPPEITTETHLYDDLHFDALDLMCVAVEVEQAIGADLPGAGLERAQTVADVLALAGSVERIAA